MPWYMTSFQSSPVRIYQRFMAIFIIDAQCRGKKVGYRSVWPTWNTVSKAIGKLLKLAGGVPPSVKLKAPPKSCMPSRAKMRIKRKSRNKSERMERMELSNEITKFLNDDQYLSNHHRDAMQPNKRKIYLTRIISLSIVLFIQTLWLWRPEEVAGLWALTDQKSRIWKPTKWPQILSRWWRRSRSGWMTTQSRSSARARTFLWTSPS